MSLEVIYLPTKPRVVGSSGLVFLNADILNKCLHDLKDLDPKGFVFSNSMDSVIHHVFSCDVAQFHTVTPYKVITNSEEFINLIMKAGEKTALQSLGHLSKLAIGLVDREGHQNG